MPFRYRLQKILDFRIRKKEEQLQEVRKAQAVVLKIEGLIERNNKEIAETRINMRQADFMMYEAYDNYLKHLYTEYILIEVFNKIYSMLFSKNIPINLSLMQCIHDLS